MRKFLIFLALGLPLTLVSCLQPEENAGQPSGSIVVIGNGSDSSATMVIDVQREDRVQSHLVTSTSNVEPVVQLVENKWVPARLNWIVRDESSGQKMVQLETEGAEAPVVLNASEGFERSQRVNDLETLSMSREIRPLFLSNGGIVFVNRSGDLIYSVDRKTSRLIDTKVVSFLIDKEARLVWTQGRGSWNYVSLVGLSADSEVASKSFDADLVFLNQEGVLSIFVWKYRTSLIKVSGIFELQSDGSFLRVASSDPDFKIWDIRTPPFHERGTTILAKITSEAIKTPSWHAVSLANHQFSVWPTENSLTEKTQVFSGAEVTVLRSTDKNSDLEICGRSDSIEATCKPLQLDFVPKQVSIGAQDHVFATRALVPIKRSREFPDPDDYDPSAQVSEVLEIKVQSPDGSFGKTIARHELVGEVHALRFFPDLKLVSSGK